MVVSRVRDFARYPVAFACVILRLDDLVITTKTGAPMPDFPQVLKFSLCTNSFSSNLVPSGGCRQQLP